MDISIENENDLIQLEQIPKDTKIISLMTNLERLNFEAYENLIGLNILEISDVKTIKLGNLVNLTELSIKGNRPETFPEGLENLTQLRELYVTGYYDNIIEKGNITEIPISIGLLRNLRIFDVQVHKITTIPTEVKHLTNLTTLCVADNNLTSLPNLSQLINLIKLNVSNNNLTSLPDLSNLQQLTHLDFSYNRLITVFPESIIKLKNLKEIYMQHCQIQQLPEDIDKLEALEHIDIVGNKIYDLPKTLLNLNKLNWTFFNAHLKAIIDFETKISKQFDIPVHLEDLLQPNKNIVDLQKPTINNQYRIQNEMFENEYYPVITLLKGTVLVTYRKLNDKKDGANDYNKYLYLNKLNVNTESYTEEFVEQSLTYFYPVPYYAKIVSDQFDTIDFVTLTEDTKLLCLISPSNLSRGHRSDTSQVHIIPCPNREYDLCLKLRLMKGLGLQGYIGIAAEDSLFEFSSYANFKFSALENVLDKEVMTNIFNKCCMDKVQTKQLKISIPEIVLVPFLFNKYDISVYKKQQESVEEIKNEPTTTIQQYQEYHKNKFSFVSFLNRNGKDLVSATALAAAELETNMPLVQSMQSPMFSLHKDYADAAKKGVFWKDHVFSLDDFKIEDVDFFATYKNPATCVSAFETMMYHALANSKLTGGRRTRKRKSKSRLTKKKGGLRFRLPSRIRKYLKKTSKKSTKTMKTMKTTEQLSFDENKGIIQTKSSNVFAKMVGNIPFFIVESKNKSTKRKTPV